MPFQFFIWLTVTPYLRAMVDRGFSAAYFVIGYFSLWGTFPFAAACCAAGVCNGYGPAVFEQFCAAVGIDRVLAVNKKY